MDVLEAIWTLRAMRRLDPGREVKESDLLLMLAAAAKAPSGGNSQPVKWIVVRESETRRRLGEIYGVEARKTLQVYEEAARSDAAVARMLKSALHLADHMGEAPVLMIACAPSGKVRVEGSIYPAAQNLMLTARALGLGTVLTSMHRSNERAVRDVLGVPPEIDICVIIPVGYPLGRWGEAPRRALSETVYWDRWKNWKELPDVRPPCLRAA